MKYIYYMFTMIIRLKKTLKITPVSIHELRGSRLCVCVCACACPCMCLWINGIRRKPFECVCSMAKMKKKNKHL